MQLYELFTFKSDKEQDPTDTFWSCNDKLLNQFKHYKPTQIKKTLIITFMTLKKFRKAILKAI
jgi:hypothetical protein